MGLREVEDGAGGIDRWALIQRAALQLALSWRSKDAYRAVLQLCGPEGIHEYSFTDPQISLPPGWTVYRHGTELLVTIRGTSNTRQWAAHVMGSWGVKDPDAEELRYLHMWMHYMAEDAIWPTIQPVIERPPPGGWTRIRLMGHSYGAGLATLLGKIIVNRLSAPPRLEVVTFGSPRVFALDRPQTVAWPLYNVFGDSDVVPRMPPPWGSARLIAGNLSSAVLGRFGAPLLGRLMGSQATGRSLALPQWRHVGRGRVELYRGGRLFWNKTETEQFAGPVVQFVATPAFTHLMNTFYWPNLVAGLLPPDLRTAPQNDLIRLIENLIGEDQPEDQTRDYGRYSRPHWPAIAADMFPDLLPAPTEADFMRAEQLQFSTTFVPGGLPLGARPAGTGGSMAVKLELDIRNVTNPGDAEEVPRIAKWKERYYLRTGSLESARALAERTADPVGNKGICHFRAAMLPVGAFVAGYTVQQMDVRVPFGEIAVSASVPVRFFVRGGFQSVSGGDVPQMGLQVEFRVVGQPQTIRYILRGLPDTVVRQGEYAVISWDPIMRQFLGVIGQTCGSYVDRRVGGAFAGVGVEEVFVNGTLTLSSPIAGVGVDDMVKVTHTTNSDGRRTGGKYRVSAVDTGVLVLAEWDRGDTTGGTVRKWERVFADYVATSGIPVIQRLRKVGSSRDYRGKNSRPRD